jgi:hypothetical protein
MPRYIDADKLIAEYDRAHIGAPGGARKLMVDAPTADVVEVVRCKDCKLRDTEGCPFMYWYCGILLGCTSDNNYCNYGERKE